MKPLVYGLAGAGVLLALVAGPVAGQARPAGPPGGGGGGGGGGGAPARWRFLRRIVRGPSGGSSGGVSSSGGGHAVYSPGSSSGGSQPASGTAHSSGYSVRLLVRHRAAPGRPGAVAQPGHPIPSTATVPPSASCTERRATTRCRVERVHTDRRPTSGRRSDTRSRASPASRPVQAVRPVAAVRRRRYQLGVRAVAVLRARLLRRALRRPVLAGRVLVPVRLRLRLRPQLGSDRSGWPRRGTGRDWRAQAEGRADQRRGATSTATTWGRSTTSTASSRRLELTSGPHHVEIRAPGYRTITFDVRIEPNDTVTYRGELQPLSKQ